MKGFSYINRRFVLGLFCLHFDQNGYKLRVAIHFSKNLFHLQLFHKITLEELALLVLRQHLFVSHFMVHYRLGFPQNLLYNLLLNIHF